jgi:hypothetical protein
MFLGNLAMYRIASLIVAETGAVEQTRHYATSRKVAGSRPDEVIFISVPNPSERTSSWGSLSL